jgi:glycosyltransferase involved in cell wall biosynthesis
MSVEKKGSIELSIVIPCLNEAETLASVIQKAHLGAKTAQVNGYEIIVADNGSTDGSQDIAVKNKARLVNVPERGYGAALQGGIRSAQGKYVIMGDADDSYDLSQISSFVEELRKGYQLVMGTRLKGEIKPGAMPFLHQYLGNPVLTFLGNLFFGSGLSDFHSGLRGFERQAILDLDLHTTGMEYASEMVIQATLKGLSRTEVPITLYPDGRSRPPHLRTWRDGWRHLRFMLLYNPRWLFLYPGIVLGLFGLIVSLILLRGPLWIGNVGLDVHTLLIASTFLVIGVQLIIFAIFSRVYATHIGLLPMNSRLEKIVDSFVLEKGLISGVITILAGFALYLVGFLQWVGSNLGPLDYQSTLRIIIPGTTLILIGFQLFFSSFIVSLLSLKSTISVKE